MKSNPKKAVSLLRICTQRQSQVYQLYPESYFINLLCLPLCGKQYIRLHGKKVQNATNNLFTFPNNFINRIGKCKLRTSILLLIDKSSLKYGFCKKFRVSVQGVKSLGGHFACLCRGFEFYEVKKKC